MYEDQDNASAGACTRYALCSLLFRDHPILTTKLLSIDCKTDVYFNTLSLLFPLIGVQTGTWWLDPVGAGLLSLFIIYDWAGTCFENVTRLSGQAADEDVQKKVLYLCYRFSPVVAGFKSVTCYHAGDGVWVEVDILLSDDTRLHKSHDIAETLQYCLEGLNEIDRAFVTTDCESNKQCISYSSADHYF